MDANHARESLQQVTGARGYARRDLSLAWLPIVLYAGFAVVAIAVPARNGGFLWIMAAPAITAAALLYAHGYRRERGIEGRPLAYVALAFGLLVVALALGAAAFALGQPALAQFGPPTVMAVGYLFLARNERNAVFALAGAAVVSVTIAVVLLGSNQLIQPVLALVYVLILLAVRVWLGRTRTSA
ncbi:MAG TPA: hypothetical protein VIN34_01270 [Candidatus Limnocylindria bacterium]|jgi:hypothetical protein